MIWCALGLISTGLGFLGLIIPGLPTTIFLIIAVGCFRKGHRGFELWLLNHKWFGSQLRDWDANHWISPRVKTIACSFMVVFVTIAVILIPNDIAKLVIALTGIAGCGYVLTRKTRPEEAPYPGPISEQPTAPLGTGFYPRGKDSAGCPLKVILKNEAPGQVIAPAGSDSDTP